MEPTRREDHLGWIFLLSLLIILAAFFSSCRTKYIEAPSVYLVHDTVWQHSHQVDSLIVRDSVYVEGARTYKERIVYKNSARTDTLYIVRTDTIEVPSPVLCKTAATVKKLPWYDRACLKIGQLCVISALLWIMFLYLKRKR